MKKKLILLLSMAMCGQYANAKVTLLEHFTKANKIDNKFYVAEDVSSEHKGQLNGKFKFVDARFGKGAIGSSDFDDIVFNANNIVNPSEGSIELWITVDKDFDKLNTNQRILRVNFDKHNQIVLYYNLKEQHLVFWMKDEDTEPSVSRYHSKNIAALIASQGALDWKKGEHHHICLSWSPKVQKLYIDGVLNSRAYFSSVTAVPTDNSKLIMFTEEDKALIFDELRIWDNMKEPENITVRPSR